MRKRVSRWVWVALIMSLAVVDAASGQDRTVTMSRQVTNERSVEVDVEYAAGRVSVGPATQSPPSIRFAPGCAGAVANISRVRRGAKSIA